MSEATGTITESTRSRLLVGAPVQEQTVVAAGVTTAVLHGGDGPPMVLLHGPGESAVVWIPVLDELVRRHRVIAADLPGHGASAVPLDEWDRDWIESWLTELIDATCAEPPVLVGRVVGGAIAAGFAATHPTKVAHLVLVDTMGLEAFAPEPRFGLALQRFLAVPSAETYERFMNLCAFDLDTARSRLGQRWAPYARYAVELAREPRMQAALGSLMGVYAAAPIPSETLAGIQVPTTLIWGRHDAATALSVAQRAAARYGWPLHVIDGAGDDPALDRPDEFVDTLLSAIARRSPTHDHRVATTETERFLETMGPRLTEVGTAMHNGDSHPWMAMWSRTEPVTLFGAVKSGRDWGELAPIFQALGEQFSNCLSYKPEIVAAEARGDLAYIVALEHTTASVNGAEPTSYVLRVTTIFRREDGEWKAVHRHGDALSADFGIDTALFTPTRNA